MIVLRFRDNEMHEDILRKLKKMKRFAEELEKCIEDKMDEPEYREDEDYDDDDSPKGRFGYRGSYKSNRRM